MKPMRQVNTSVKSKDCKNKYTQNSKFHKQIRKIVLKSKNHELFAKKMLYVCGRILRKFDFY